MFINGSKLPKEKYFYDCAFLSAFVVSLSGSMMPGSLLTYTIRKALSAGQRAGFIITAGHAVLELILVIVIFFGIRFIYGAAIKLI